MIVIVIVKLIVIVIVVVVVKGGTPYYPPYRFSWVCQKSSAYPRSADSVSRAPHSKKREIYAYIKPYGTDSSISPVKYALMKLSDL